MGNLLRISASLVMLFLATAAPLSAAERGMPEHLRQAFIERHSPERIAKLQSAIDAQARHTNGLIAQQGVIGTGVTWNKANQAAIVIYIEETRSQAGLPARLDGMPVVIERLNGIWSYSVSCELRGDCDSVPDAEVSSGSEPASQTDWHERPVPIGVSISQAWGSDAGTLACRVSNGCHKYALSNSHVLRGNNLAAGQGVSTIQPGKADQGIYPDHKIGALDQWVEIEFGTLPSVNNRVDAAISKLSGPTVGTATRSDGYGGLQSETVSAYVGQQVMKYGRTSAYTEGYVAAINATLVVGFNPGPARFTGQIVIKTSSGPYFSTNGDSGALVVARGGADDRKPVGLIFAAGTDSNNESVSIANQIDEVLGAFGVGIDGEGT